MNGETGAKARCTICGVESSRPDLFRTERRSFRTSFLNYCPQCWAQRLKKRKRRRLLNFVLIAGAGLALVALSSESPTGWRLLNIAWLEVCLVATIAPHEFAHAFAARAVGLRVFRVVLGSGTTWWSGSVFGFAVEAKTLPFDGVVIAAHRDSSAALTKRLFFISAGLVANVLLILLAWAAVGPRLWEWTIFSRQWAPWQVFGLANLLTVITNLWPHQIQTSVGVLPSDGRQLLDALLGRSKMTPEQRHAAWFLLEALYCVEQRNAAEARVWLERGLAIYPEDYRLSSTRGVLLMNAGELDAARDVMVPLLDKSGISDDVRLILKNNIAYLDALLDRSDLLEEADQYSAEVLTAFPWHRSLRNTRGVVLLALGRLDEALPVLRNSVLLPPEAPAHVAQTQSTLAMAEARAGQIAAAERALEIARLAEPDCFLIPRAETALQTACERAGAVDVMKGA